LPLASSTSEISSTFTASLREFFNSVCTRTVAFSSDTCGVVTKVPYQAT
jgi:hypothetical protein